MSYDSILEYLNALSKIYFSASKKEKTKLLNHAIQVTKLHRKSIIRAIKNGNIINRRGKGLKKHKILYPKDTLSPHIEYIWHSMERISAKRMKEALKDWLPYYHENKVDNHIKYLLQKMSITTLERFLKELRVKSTVSKGLTSTSPARHMKNKVPINTLDSNVTKPGHTQADTVAHCGDKLIGEFMNSITLTDIHSAWTMNRATFTKTALDVKDALKHIQKCLPFKLLTINTDSGSEFLNIPIFNHFQREKVIFTRSRPYKKNDNAYVEQKNYTHVRELFGYQRIEHEELKSLMNEIYCEYWNPLQNYFLPTFKLKEKIMIGAKIKKTYGKPQTPYQRLMECDNLTEDQKEELSRVKKKLNPFVLKRELEKKLSVFFVRLNELNKIKKEN
ncbi:MAG: integrase [Oligoflexia bacterium]|nr:integrase [Oligoflexia bacterium]